VADGIPAEELCERVARALGVLHEKAQAGRLCLAPELGRDPAQVVAAAERALALYHLPPPLERRGDRVHLGNRALVYYYRNRLAGYALDPYAFLEPRARKGNRR
jgi:hypothetical protein